jgi:hypothetical protein
MVGGTPTGQYGVLFLNFIFAMLCISAIQPCDAWLGNLLGLGAAPSPTPVPGENAPLASVECQLHVHRTCKGHPGKLLSVEHTKVPNLAGANVEWARKHLAISHESLKAARQSRKQLLDCFVSDDSKSGIVDVCGQNVYDAVMDNLVPKLSRRKCRAVVESHCPSLTRAKGRDAGRNPLFILNKAGVEAARCIAQEDVRANVEARCGVGLPCYFARRALCGTKIGSPGVATSQALRGPNPNNFPTPSGIVFRTDEAQVYFDSIDANVDGAISGELELKRFLKWLGDVAGGKDMRISAELVRAFLPSGATQLTRKDFLRTFETYTSGLLGRPAPAYDACLAMHTDILEQFPGKCAEAGTENVGRSFLKGTVHTARPLRPDQIFHFLPLPGEPAL